MDDEKHISPRLPAEPHTRPAGQAGHDHPWLDSKIAHLRKTARGKTDTPGGTSV
ncbi:MAG TPA: hypothetical protein H9836_04000 [Candidatus Nocardiopsis merdipullorum]|nr:hypothetical protein [Candidatus Nocardiopsis merdipullorum]